MNNMLNRNIAVSQSSCLPGWTFFRHIFGQGVSDPQPKPTVIVALGVSEESLKRYLSESPRAEYRQRLKIAKALRDYRGNKQFPKFINECPTLTRHYSNGKSLTLSHCIEDGKESLVYYSFSIEGFSRITRLPDGLRPRHFAVYNCDNLQELPTGTGTNNWNMRKLVVHGCRSLNSLPSEMHLTEFDLRGSCFVDRSGRWIHPSQPPNWYLNKFKQERCQSEMRRLAQKLDLELARDLKKQRDEEYAIKMIDREIHGRNRMHQAIIENQFDPARDYNMTDEEWHAHQKHKKMLEIDAQLARVRADREQRYLEQENLKRYGTVHPTEYQIRVWEAEEQKRKTEAAVWEANQKKERAAAWERMEYYRASLEEDRNREREQVVYEASIRESKRREYELEVRRRDEIAQQGFSFL